MNIICPLKKALIADTAKENGGERKSAASGRGIVSRGLSAAIRAERFRR